MPSHFRRFAPEAQSVGSILTGYTNLELGLVHCLMAVTGDFDGPLRLVFSVRGEANRIKRAEDFGKPLFKTIRLVGAFEVAIDAMRHCLKIRNQYAHWIWWDDYSGKMAFANIEEITKQKTKISNLNSLKHYHVDDLLLRAQTGFFAYTDQCLGWVNFEAKKRSGKSPKNPLGPRPKTVVKPKLRMP